MLGIHPSLPKIVGTSITCKTHTNQQLIYYCKNHNKFLCADCIFLHVNDLQNGDVDKINEDQILNKISSFKEMLQKGKDNIDNFYNTLEEIVNK